RDFHVTGVQTCALPIYIQGSRPMKIKLTTIYVDDQEKALRFYTDVLGLQAKNDFSNQGYRWLTVASPEEPDGTELQLALNDNPRSEERRVGTECTDRRR